MHTPDKNNLKWITNTNEWREASKQKLKINFNGRESRSPYRRTENGRSLQDWQTWSLPLSCRSCSEHFVAIDGVENGSKSSGYHLYLNKGVPGEHIIQVGEGVVDILPQPVLNGDEAADTVVWVVVRPGTGTISIDVVIVNPLFYAV